MPLNLTIRDKKSGLEFLFPDGRKMSIRVLRPASSVTLQIEGSLDVNIKRRDVCAYCGELHNIEHIINEKEKIHFMTCPNAGDGIMFLKKPE